MCIRDRDYDAFKSVTVDAANCKIYIYSSDNGKYGEMCIRDRLTDEALATAKASDAVLLGAVGGRVGAVSYTHLDVYKRQDLYSATGMPTALSFEGLKSDISGGNTMAAMGMQHAAASKKPFFIDGDNVNLSLIHIFRQFPNFE